MSARDVIASLLEDEFGRHADEQADAIIAGLEASGRAIVHKDEIHAPSVERAIAVAEKYCADENKQSSLHPALAWSDEEKQMWQCGQLDGASAIAAALRELMKEAGRG